MKYFSKSFPLIVYLCLFCLAMPNLVLFVPEELPKTSLPDPIPKHMTASWFPKGVTAASMTCNPSLKNLEIPSRVLGLAPNEKVSKELKFLAEQDQLDRNGGNPKVSLNDLNRRKKVVPLIEFASAAADFENIAMIFQHGVCLDHYRLANKMAKIALEINPTLSKSLAAVTMDRALAFAGRPQLYGTQSVMLDNSKCNRLYVVDPTITDSDRRNMGVKSLRDAIKFAEKNNPVECRL
jgi:hypothetical protein